MREENDRRANVDRVDWIFVIIVIKCLSRMHFWRLFMFFDFYTQFIVSRRSTPTIMCHAYAARIQTAILPNPKTPTSNIHFPVSEFSAHGYKWFYENTIASHRIAQYLHEKRRTISIYNCVPADHKLRAPWMLRTRVYRRSFVLKAHTVASRAGVRFDANLRMPPSNVQLVNVSGRKASASNILVSVRCSAKFIDRIMVNWNFLY